MRSSSRAGIAGLTFALLVLAGCSSPAGPSGNTGQPTQTNIAGVWLFKVNVTAANGACAGESGLSTETITITQTGSAFPYAVAASGWIGQPTSTISGSLTATGMVLSGSYPEDGGTTTTTHTLTRTSLTTFTGTEAWSWTDGNGVCPNGAATVTATWK